MKADVLILALLFFCGALFYTDACSCMRYHPQDHFCNSDFVILARVKRERLFNDTKVYKVRVRKEFKVSEKGVLALKAGRLNTPIYDSMCGVSLDIGKLYVISGRILSLKAYINSCGMIMSWERLTRRQRKGLKLLYRHGCSCRINNCLYGRCSRRLDSCNWKTECESQEGICLRKSNHSCMWTKTKALTKCRRDRNKT